MIVEMVVTMIILQSRYGTRPRSLWTVLNLTFLSLLVWDFSWWASYLEKKNYGLILRSQHLPFNYLAFTICWQILLNLLSLGTKKSGQSKYGWFSLRSSSFRFLLISACWCFAWMSFMSRFWGLFVEFSASVVVLLVLEGGIPICPFSFIFSLIL